MITRKSFLKKALATSIAFTSMTTAQNAIAATYRYDVSNTFSGALTLTNNDTVQLYTNASGPGGGAGLISAPNIFG